ncbi:MAG: helix-turn-helix domain-containing protein [Solirubrobacteraceae bacterium]|nr:helix-turn-helix domain-containing protein [Solirubrobacteraceae bacterium]
MAVVVDTGAVPPHERFDLWAEVSARVFEPISVAPRVERPFAARLHRWELGALNLYRMWSDPSAVHRSARGIRAGDPEIVHVMLQRRGRCVVAQDGRRGVAGPGQLVVWQSSAPYALEPPEPFESLIVEIPVVLLGPHADRICARTADPVDADRGVPRLVARYLRELFAGLGDGTIAGGGPLLADSFVELVRALYADDGPRAPEPRALRSRDVLRRRIAAYIDERLGDPSLGPEEIARAHHISRSYLDKLFAAEGTTVRESIRDRRLERCRADLLDPALAGVPVFDIAVRWGFVSASHFSRVFRGAYGMAPSEFRAAFAG